jgi:hypothetical protein
LALPGIGALIGLVRRVDRLFENVEKTQRGLEALEKRVSAVEDRMTALEANQEKLIIEPKSGSWLNWRLFVRGVLQPEVGFKPGRGAAAAEVGVRAGSVAGPR